MTGALNTLATNTVSTTTSLLSGDFGTIVVVLLAISLLALLVAKVRGALGFGG